MFSACEEDDAAFRSHMVWYDMRLRNQEENHK